MYVDTLLSTRESYVRRNLLLFHRYGAELVYSKGMLKAGIDFYTTLRLRHPRAYFLYAGGSTPSEPLVL